MRLIRRKKKGGTHESEPIRVWVTRDVLLEFPTRHPRGDELERLKRDTKEGNDVWVRQTFPHDSLAVECLLVWSLGRMVRQLH